VTKKEIKIKDYQCRGHITAILKSGNNNFIQIKAITQFDYKKNKLKNDSNVFNVLAKVDSPQPNYAAKDNESLIVPEEEYIEFDDNYAELVKIAYEKDVLTVFVVEKQSGVSSYNLVYIQVGPEND
jgi:hypothetical protein